MKGKGAKTRTHTYPKNRDRNTCNPSAESRSGWQIKSR